MFFQSLGFQAFSQHFHRYFARFSQHFLTIIGPIHNWVFPCCRTSTNPARNSGDGRCIWRFWIRPSKCVACSRHHVSFVWTDAPHVEYLVLGGLYNGLNPLLVISFKCINLAYTYNLTYIILYFHEQNQGYKLIVCGSFAAGLSRVLRRG